MPSYLFISDIHMSNNLPFARPTAGGMTDRLEHQLDMWKEVAADAKENGVEGAFVLGDLFDKSKLDPITLVATARAITDFQEEIGAPVWFLPGNHEAVGVKGERFNVEVFGAVGSDLIKYRGEGVVKLHPWLAFHFLEYGTHEATRERLAKAKAQMIDGQNILLMHHSITGAESFGWVCDDGLEAEEVCEGFDLTLSGHFHQTQKFGATGMYLGSPMHHNYNDVGREATYYIGKFNKGKKPKMYKRETVAPKFHALTYDAATVPADIDWAAEGIASGDYVRLSIRATASDWTASSVVAARLEASAAEQGVRAKAKQVPIPSHRKRTEAASGAKEGSLSLDVLIREYVDHDAVDIGGLDAARLKALGAEILGEARASC